MGSKMSNQELIERINNYLYTGGLFNPELADHELVRMLLIDCRWALENTPTDSKVIGLQ
jgi:hypothetical protein